MGTGRVLSGVGLAAIPAAVTVALLANTSNPPSGQSASPELRVPAALAGTPLVSARAAGGLAVRLSAPPSPRHAAALLWRMHRRRPQSARDARWVAVPGEPAGVLRELLELYP